MFTDTSLWLGSPIFSDIPLQPFVHIKSPHPSLTIFAPAHLPGFHLSLAFYLPGVAICFVPSCFFFLLVGSCSHACALSRVSFNVVGSLVPLPLCATPVPRSVTSPPNSVLSWVASDSCQSRPAAVKVVAAEDLGARAVTARRRRQQVQTAVDGGGGGE